MNIKLTMATYGGFPAYFKYQTENYEAVISAQAESAMRILGLRAEKVKCTGIMPPAAKSRL